MNKISDIRVGFHISISSYMYIHMIISNTSLCVSEGTQRFRAEGICFMEELSVKRRDYHLGLLFFGAPTPQNLG